MIFWILLALAVIVVVLTFLWWLGEDGLLLAFGVSFLAAIGAFVVGVLLMLLLSIWFGPTYQPRGNDSKDLVALETASSVEGRSYFLGAGYINGKRTLNYITNESGAFRVESADADASVIYQDSTDPTVTIYHWAYANPWFAPVDFGASDTYEFHVPEGSILSDYTIDNG